MKPNFNILTVRNYFKIAKYILYYYHDEAFLFGNNLNTFIFQNNIMDKKSPNFSKKGIKEALF